MARAIAIARMEGLEAVGFQRLANDAQVGLRTVFRHFPTRGELIDAVLTECVVNVPERQSNSLPELVESISGKSEQLGNLAVFGRLSDETIPGILKALAVFPTDPALPAVCILLSPPSWQMLRRKYAMSVDKAMDYLQSMIPRLLEGMGQAIPSVPAPLISQPDDFID